MDRQIKTKQLVKQKNYTLELAQIDKTIQLKLIVQAQKLKKQFYHLVISSLSDVKDLQSQFYSLDLLREHLQDPQNIEVDIENKRVIVKEHNKRTKKILQIGIIQLQLKEIQEICGQHQLLNTVLQRCQSKKALDNEQMKDILQKMVMCLSELLVRKTVLTAQKQQLQSKNKKLHEQLRNSQCQSKLIENEYISINEANQIRREIKDLKQSFEKRFADLEKKIEIVSEQKLDFTQNMYVNQQNNQKIQNIIVSRIREEEQVRQMKEKLLKIQQRFKSGIKEQNIMTESSSVLNIKDLIDEQSLWAKKITLNGNTMTTKQYTHVFGKKKLCGKCSYKIKFNKIDENGVGLGIIDSSFKNKNVISLKEWIYFLNSGVCQEGGQMLDMMSGFKQNQQVTVEIDFQQGIIKWKVGSDIRYQKQFPILKQKSINWVSYIYFGTKDITATIY